jgi:hypothetical protein
VPAAVTCIKGTTVANKNVRRIPRTVFATSFASPHYSSEGKYHLWKPIFQKPVLERDSAPEEAFLNSERFKIGGIVRLGMKE